MPSLDTNVILRYIVEDDPRQTRVAQRTIEKHAGEGRSLFLGTSVILIFQDEASLERAVHRYRESNIDFADCLHVATAETFDQLPLASFEKKARDIDDFEALRG